MINWYNEKKSTTIDEEEKHKLINFFQLSIENDMQKNLSSK